MAGIEVRDFDSPDETRSPDKTKAEIVRMGGSTVARLTLQPGWSWESCIKPVVGGERCQIHHVGVAQSGRMHIEHDDGTTQEISAGQTYVIEPGHNAWIIGDETFVGYEFDRRAAEEYAKA
jgi:hypothetical protein